MPHPCSPKFNYNGWLAALATSKARWSINIYKMEAKKILHSNCLNLCLSYDYCFRTKMTSKLIQRFFYWKDLKFLLKIIFLFARAHKDEPWTQFTGVIIQRFTLSQLRHPYSSKNLVALAIICGLTISGIMCNNKRESYCILILFLNPKLKNRICLSFSHLSFFLPSFLFFKAST